MGSEEVLFSKWCKMFSLCLSDVRQQDFSITYLGYLKNCLKLKRKIACIWMIWNKRYIEKDKSRESKSKNQFCVIFTLAPYLGRLINICCDVIVVSNQTGPPRDIFFGLKIQNSAIQDIQKKGILSILNLAYHVQS